jgi:hypothetical protein
MKYFFDCEFIESGSKNPIQLISIGMVCEDGREYYAISDEFDPTTASDWVVENVILKLERDVERKSNKDIASDLVRFVWADVDGNREKPEFWAYYADYDWVVFCQLFGAMMDLPSDFPMYCRDIKQWCSQLGNPRLPPQETGEHNALADARWNSEAYDFLSSVNGRRRISDTERIVAIVEAVVMNSARLQKTSLIDNIRSEVSKYFAT